MIEQQIDLRDATDFTPMSGSLLDESGREGEVVDIFYSIGGAHHCLTITMTSDQAAQLAGRLEKARTSVIVHDADGKVVTLQADSIEIYIGPHDVNHPPRDPEPGEHLVVVRLLRGEVVEVVGKDVDV